MHEEIIYQFATTEDEDEAYSILLLMIEQFLAQYTAARELFAADNSFELKGYSDESVFDEYALYLFGIFTGLRERAKEQRERLRSQDLNKTEHLIALRRFIINEYETIEATEQGNAIQMGQLSAITALQDQRCDIRIFKEWVAHPDCCEICKKLNGTILPIEAPFLVDGQVVELPEGKEFVYQYIDRLIAIAHPNDRCHVEFIIEI